MQLVVRRFMLPYYRLLLQIRCLHAAEFPFSFRASSIWPPVLCCSRLVCRLNICVKAVKSRCFPKIVQLDLCLKVSTFDMCLFSRTFLGLWRNLSNLRTFPGPEIISLNSRTFSVFPDPWEPWLDKMYIIPALGLIIQRGRHVHRRFII